MNDDQQQLYLRIKNEIQRIEEALDELHHEEASIAADIDALVRAARARDLHFVEHQLQAAATRLANAGSLLAQVAIDLQAPATGFAPKPQEMPGREGDEPQQEAA